MTTPDTETGSIFREQRAAKNQSLFREVNERIEPLNQAFAVINRLTDFVCECPSETCTATVVLSMKEYEAVRRHPNRFFVLPDDEHVWPDIERVVERVDRYWVVEKVGYAATVTAKLDPRSRATRTTDPPTPTLRSV